VTDCRWCHSEGFDLLAVGGHPYEVSAFTKVLPRSLRERLAGTFSIDARAATPADLRGLDADD
jgi:peptide chain release factor subunit 1